MSRRARIIAAGYPHHVVHRGHNRQNVFRDNYDRWFFQKLLAIYLGKFECKLLAYCLMRNHVHLMLLPEKRDSLIEFMHGLSFRYAMYFNITSDRKGSLWESRYFSSVVTEEAYMWRAAKYICLNPVRAGIVEDPCDYTWSCARGLMLGEDGEVPVEEWIGEAQRRDFREMVLHDSEANEIGYLLERGLPYTSAGGFLKLGQRMGRVLVPRAKGRPRKAI
jgi:putative transposase